MIRWTRWVSLAFWLLLALALTAGAYSYRLEGQFITHPHVPQRNAGLVLPYSMKGMVVYVTQRELTTAKIVHLTEASSVILLAAIFLLTRRSSGGE